MSFENIVNLIYSQIKVKTGKSKAELTKQAQLSVTFASGYLAGILCAIISHPADTIVSKLN